MSMLGKLIHYTADAILVSAVLAGIKRSTGLGYRVYCFRGCSVRPSGGGAGADGMIALKYNFDSLLLDNSQRRNVQDREQGRPLGGGEVPRRGRMGL
ncbi:hypothetical protein BC936DRAFT_141481 [Jimgerdemannia flammicorona]|uniref:DUF1748-domain-containing protein n=1 Tax=Jimgerdemannia flammicorona TaxID=994334 RepID=A0A433A257_9FUNG|nr:hypothetical protein BC936DRAFT_141481 [Jimgerdemannia flammicorona]